MSKYSFPFVTLMKSNKSHYRKPLYQKPLSTLVLGLIPSYFLKISLIVTLPLSLPSHQFIHFWRNFLPASIMIYMITAHYLLFQQHPLLLDKFSCIFKFFQLYLYSVSLNQNGSLANSEALSYSWLISRTYNSSRNTVHTYQIVNDLWKQQETSQDTLLFLIASQKFLLYIDRDEPSPNSTCWSHLCLDY